jgi:hypothetical protein
MNTFWNKKAHDLEKIFVNNVSYKVLVRYKNKDMKNIVITYISIIKKTNQFKMGKRLE